MNTTTTDAVVTERSGAVQLMELNRPDKSNAVTFAMYDALTAAISDAEQDWAIRVMLIHGRGDSFTAGNDLGDFLRNPPTSADPPPVRFLHALSQAPSQSSPRCRATLSGWARRCCSTAIWSTRRPMPSSCCPL